MVPALYREIMVPDVYRRKVSSLLFKEEKPSPPLYRRDNVPTRIQEAFDPILIQKKASSHMFKEEKASPAVYRKNCQL